MRKAKLFYNWGIAKRHWRKTVYLTHTYEYEFIREDETDTYMHEASLTAFTSSLNIWRFSVVVEAQNASNMCAGLFRRCEFTKFLSIMKIFYKFLFEVDCEYFQWVSSIIRIEETRGETEIFVKLVRRGESGNIRIVKLLFDYPQKSPNLSIQSRDTHIIGIIRGKMESRVLIH